MFGIRKMKRRLKELERLVNDQKSINDHYDVEITSLRKRMNEAEIGVQGINLEYKKLMRSTKKKATKKPWTKDTAVEYLIKSGGKLVYGSGIKPMLVSYKDEKIHFDQLANKEFGKALSTVTKFEYGKLRKSVTL